MGAVRFSIDSGLVRELRAGLPLKVFVETGTYDGASVREVLPLFDELHTIELSPALYSSAAQEFEETANVHVHHGRSEDVLGKIVPSLRRKSVLYWLDAHWCDEKSAGEDVQCALLGELEAIGSVNDRSVVLIDDARLFMAPPPKPAVTEGWPQFSEVLDRLSALNSDHELLVIDDVIVFFPPLVRERVRDYAHHHAVDWLSELQVSARVEHRLERLRVEFTNRQTQAAKQGRKRADQLGKQLTELSASIGSLKAEVHALGRSQLSESALDERVRPLESEIELTRSQLESVRSGLSAPEARLDERLAPLAAGVESTGPQLESVFKSLRGLRGRLQRISDQLSELAEAHAELKAPAAMDEGSLAALGQSMGDLRTQSSDLSKARGEIASLSKRVDDLGGELERLRPAVERGLAQQSDRSQATLEQLRGMRRQMRALAERLDERERRGRMGRTRAFVERVGMRLYGPRLGGFDHHRPRELRIPRRYRRERAPAQAPAISIVTPADDNAVFLDRTIRSVLDQGYEPLEYIVESCDSSRETAGVLERYRSRLAHCERPVNGKPAAALNQGFDHATGAVLAYVRPQALLLPGALPYVARYLERHPEVDVIYGHRVLVDAEDKEVGRWVLPRHRDEVLSWADYVPAETLFWRRSVWEAIGGEVDEDLRESLDWDLLLRFRDVGARMARVPRFLGAARVSEAKERSSSGPALNGNEEMQRLLARVHGREVSDEEAQREVRGYIRRHVLLQKLYRLRLLRY